MSVERQDGTSRTHTLRPKIAGVALTLGGLAVTTAGLVDLSNCDNRAETRFNNEHQPLSTSPSEINTARADYAFYHAQIDRAILDLQPLPTVEPELERKITLIKQDDLRNEASSNTPLFEGLRNIVLDVAVGFAGGLCAACYGVYLFLKKQPQQKLSPKLSKV